MLSWEYPPRIVGGIARHVEEIAWALAARGDDVHVVTCEFPGAPVEEAYNGVHIHRVHPYEPSDNFIHWVHQLNSAMKDRAAALLTEWGVDSAKLKDGPPSEGIILHAHDWLAHFSAVELKHQFHLPMVSTVHATEYGRNDGIHSDISRYINSVEWEMTYESWRVIVCSDFMRGEVMHALGTPYDKVDVIPNGVHAEKFDFEFSAEDAKEFRAQYAQPWEKLIFFVGRMVREKGAHVLIEAVARLRAQGDPVKLLLVGGGYRDHLFELVERTGISQNVFLTGFISDDILLRLYNVIDIACYPSLYEPFGIVALEAMAASVPVVVSDAGGLREIVEHNVTGTVTWAGNPDSLTWGLQQVIHNPGHAYWMAENARKKVLEEFNWDRIAGLTQSVYQRVWQEFSRSTW